MTKFIKAKRKKSDDQANIDKYRVATKIYRISFCTKLNLPKNHHSKIYHDKAKISRKKYM